MIISKEMINNKISIEDFCNVKHNCTLLGVLSKKFPKIIIIHIIDFTGIRFTTYSNCTSEYYKYKINSLLSWPDWRIRNCLPLYEYKILDEEIKALKKYARREIYNEKLSLLIYGF